MIDAVNEALRRVLVAELPIRNNEIDIAFDQPRRDWSARLSRPTLNLFLFDIRQNANLRAASPGWEVTRRTDGRVEQKRVAPRVDLNYMITAWATAPEDEHRLLASTFMALFRTTVIPEAVLPEALHDQPAPMNLQVAHTTDLMKASEMWGVLSNELRPHLVCTTTVALDPFTPIEGPLVRSREIRLTATTTGSTEPARWLVGGYLRDFPSLTNVELTLLERALPILLRPDGGWSVGRLREGSYTLVINQPGTAPRTVPFTVPAPSYDVAWE